MCATGAARDGGWGADEKARIERMCISLPYVEEPLNSKVIKSFVPELRSRKCFCVSGFLCSMLCIYVMNILCTFYPYPYLAMVQYTNTEIRTHTHTYIYIWKKIMNRQFVNLWIDNLWIDNLWICESTICEEKLTTSNPNRKWGFIEKQSQSTL